jgi:hypothetical protein
MAAPPLTLTVQPSDASNRVLYLPIAAKSTQHKAQVKIVVRLRIANTGASDVLLKGIEFSFPGSGIAKQTMQGVKIAVSTEADPDPDDGRIPAGQAVRWSNGVVDLDTSEAGENKIRNEVYLDAPAPPKLKISVSCENFSDPVTVTMDLAPYEDPTGEGAFIMPFAPYDLDSGEYIITSARHWANGGPNGAQIYAHDIGIQAKVDGSWTTVKAGESSTTNEGRRIFGKPVRAMADGNVLSWKSDTPENEAPGKKPDPVPEGNHFWIQHGAVKVKYAHLKHGSLEAALMQEGAAVRAGQQIARAGNNGNSEGPHLHIESVHVDSGTLRGFPFKNAWQLERDRIEADHGGPWVRMRADGISADSVALWPASTRPRTVVAAAGVERGGDWALSLWASPDLATFKAETQKLFTEKGRRLIQCATYLERGERRWMGLARGGDWANSFWVSTSLSAFKAEVQRLFDEKGRRLVHVHTFPHGANGRRWAGIARGANWSNSFWVSDSFAAFDAEVKKLWKDKGRALMHVCTYREGSARRWVGIARGSDEASTFYVADGQSAFSHKVQSLFDTKGLRLEHVHTFVEAGQRRWVGISRPGNGSNHFWVSRDLDGFRRRVQDGFDDHGQRLICLELLDNEG